ncbi:TPA: AlpA family transcriptional regulator [Pseudomonas aeruginosa]|uniref:helix-turn-helix transcriptional regulator n=1 Tax=Pseudomonas aeruginosa TaxID=287 RepID=UPI001371A9E1|nr:AlpA family transcriptional regulator [Pseudomonas aeruginosa]MXU52371.1 AlpA family phage regulatory protein [Pseudomonas aeruginosa]HBN9846903.1 AlpA family transcriptional regulator [Pseudomonas aeruginosa]HBN9848099.1 AlpA family transcriptional regulator [Pseudomonas aeruginosa]
MAIRSILRLPQVIDVTGYKRTSIYRMMKNSTFPKSHRIGARAVGWDSAEILDWVKSRLDGGV